METIVFNVDSVQTFDNILKEGLSTLSHSMVKNAKICELGLSSKNMSISLLVPINVFNTIKDDKKILVKAKGFWSTLTDKNVKVTRENGEVIKPIRTF